MSIPKAEQLLDPSFLASLDRLSLRARRPMRGQLLGARRSLRHGASVEFSDFRDYIPGDDLRTIDWKAYGRLDKLLVKLFREEDDLSLHLLLDASLSMTFGSPGKLLFAKKLCAALGAVALLDYDRCSLNILGGNGSSTPATAHTLRGRSSLPALLTRLSRSEASGQARIASALSVVTQRRNSPGVLVLVSDFYDHRLTPALLVRARRTMDVVLAHIVAPEEIDPASLSETSDSGQVRLIDSETGEALDLTLASASIDRYREEFTEFCDNLAETARAAGATYTRIATTTPLEDVVLGTLRANSLVS